MNLTTSSHHSRYNKQILYPSIISRMFASTIDLFILAILNLPIMSIISKLIFYLFFHTVIDTHNININKLEDFYKFLEIVGISKLFTYYSILMLINCVITFVFFFSFWYYKSATPGKMLLRIKIVDVSSLEKPSKTQLILRLISYLTAPFGMWLAIFTKHKQALHDKLSNTMIIKK